MNTEPKSEQPFDRNLPYRMRNGWQAKILADNLSGQFPLLIIYKDNRGHIGFTTHCLDGRKFSDRCVAMDLVNIPPEPERTKGQRWSNIYKDSICHYPTLDAAIKADSPDVLARICIDFDIPIGTGLDGSPVPVFKEVKEDGELMAAVTKVFDILDPKKSFNVGDLKGAIENLRRAAKLE